MQDGSEETTNVETESTESNESNERPRMTVHEALVALRESVPDCWVAGLTKLCRPDGGHLHHGEPCLTLGKRPLLVRFNTAAVERYEADARGRLDRDAHRLTAARWLGAGYNVGLVPPPGVVALDCDTLRAVEWVRDELAGLRGVPCQIRTPEKAHLWLRYDAEETPLRASQLRWDDPESGERIQIDLRVGGRSQAVVAPSRHVSGVDYRWLSDLGLPARLDGVPMMPGGLAGALMTLLGPDPAIRSRLSELQLAASREGRDGDDGDDGDGGNVEPGSDRPDYARVAVPGHDRLLGYVNRLCRYAAAGGPQDTGEEARAAIRVRAEAFAREIYGSRPGGGARLEGILRAGGELDRMLVSGWARFGGASPASEDRTDQGYLETLVATYGDRWRWVEERRAWVQWSGVIWEGVSEEAVGRAVGALHRVLFEDSAREVDGERRKRLAAMSSQLRNNAKVESILKRARKVYAISETRLDAAPWLLTFPAATRSEEDRARYPAVTVDLQKLATGADGAVRAPSPDDYGTRVMGGPWVPGARSRDVSRFLAETFQTEEAENGAEGAETLEWFARVLGMALVGRVLEHVFVFLFGPGGTGKSTLLGAVLGAFGGYGVRADFRTFAEPGGRGGYAGGAGASPDIARLKGARLVVCSEIPERARLGARMKDLTGGDRIVGRPLYGGMIEFEPSHTVMVAGNAEPLAEALDTGIWRRMRQVPLFHRPADETIDPMLPLRLASETARAALCQWMVGGWVAYQREGLGDCPAVAQATEEYRASLSPIDQWWSDCVEVGPNFEVPVSEAYSHYCRYMDENFEGATRDEVPRISQRAFAFYVQKGGTKRVKGAHGRRFYRGFRLSATQKSGSRLGLIM